MTRLREEVARALYALEEPEVWQDVQNGESPEEHFTREALSYRGEDADVVLAIVNPAEVLEAEADHAEATIGGYGDHIAIHLRNRAATYREQR